MEFMTSTYSNTNSGSLFCIIIFQFLLKYSSLLGCDWQTVVLLILMIIEGLCRELSK